MVTNYFSIVRETFRYGGWVVGAFTLNIFMTMLLIWCCLQCSGPSDPILAIRDSNTDVDVDVSITLFDFDDD